MTDTEKVALCREMIQNFCDSCDRGSEGALDAVLTCIGTVLDFKEGDTNG